MLRRLLRWAAFAAYALLVLLVFTVSAYFAFSQWVRRGVTTVPELAGMSEEEATRLLADVGLAERRAETDRWSESVPPGRVVETRPRAGSFVKRGAEIEVVLSLGARRIAVPELNGKAIAAATLVLRSEGLEPGATLAVFATQGEPGTVVGQDPPAGAAAPPGSAVDLLVALDRAGATYVMPDLVYRHYEAVRSSFERSGFRLAPVTREPYEGVSEGTILRQQPLPGHPLRRSDTIALVVAAAAQPEVTP